MFKKRSIINLPSHISNSNAHQVIRITWIGLVVNLLLTAIKFVVGFWGSSQAVIADAVHSLSDMITDIVILLGVLFWSAPADENHPYGHSRIETMVTVFIGIALAVVALGLSYKSITTVRGIHLKQPQWIAVSGPLLSVILKEILYHWTVGVGLRIKSSAVIANAWHHRSDALSSLPALIAVAVAAINPDWAFIDQVGALIVSIFILKVSWDILSPALAELADSGASQKDREMIKAIIMSVNGVHYAHSIRTRIFGQGIHVDLHIKVDGDMTVRMGHNISEKVKHELIDKGPDVLDVIVHLEPFEP